MDRVSHNLGEPRVQCVGSWDLKKSDAQRSSWHFDTPADAIDRARDILHNASGGELNIHG
ncbi:DUF2188 domain-containing protein [Cellulomonas humilata]|uniref:DUF2188 domain-containing protein n=1 Tax=Cellulomonas humilata TaxID=144055 RepID=UPI0031B58B8A